VTPTLAGNSFYRTVRKGSDAYCFWVGAVNSFERALRHYNRHAGEIMANPANRWAIEPYAWEFDAGLKLTPIERSLWSDIRAESAVFYPQFPVGPYFVDFGNPVAKVAVECDGAEWHLDSAKDAKRQRQIEAMGWAVYRISGSDCKKAETYAADEQGCERVEFGPARQFIREIVRRHGIAS
jgi:Protein of unknown function (DUF559)